MKNFLFAFLFFALGALFVSEANAQTVGGSLKTAIKGKTVRGYVVLSIPKGLHVNSYRPKSEYAIPTRMNVSAVGAKAFGVTYPPGKMRTFSFSKTPISVYEGRAVFGFKLTVPKTYRRRYVTVKAKVRYQACTDEVCYAPKTKVVNLRARVR
ncbi:MAG: hypothetical protein HKN25_00175 [Pyrinomonadaceae bacterium]|nr:hypothetical protein [Pyrinomonadaceae bacterium]